MKLSCSIAVSFKSSDLSSCFLLAADCPVSEIEDYRVEVLIHLRKLERLDKDPFSADERVDAEEVCMCVRVCVSDESVHECVCVCAYVCMYMVCLCAL